MLFALLAASPALAEEAPAKWGPWIDFEGKAGTKRNLGEADAFLPLAQNADTLFFGNARFRFDDRRSLEGNLGLGLRHMLDDGWNFGGYGYFDRRRSGNHKTYNQLAFGAELLGANFDFRANSYWPVGNRTHSLETTSGGETTATLTGTTIEVVTPGATTRQERALRGFDAEVGWRLPVIEAEGPLDLRLYAGGFRFDDGAVDDVTGPRLRAEFTAYAVPYLWDGARLTLGADWQHDDVRGSQAFASLRLRIPLQPEAGRARALTAQERRMTAPVVRDVDIVTQTHSVKATPDIVETATETAGGSPITVLDSTTTSGTGLPTAVAGAGANSTVILTGTFNTTTAVAMQTGQTLMGAGTLTVRTPSGRSASLTTPGGTIAANTAASGSPAVTLANNSTLTGLAVSNTINTGIAGAVAVRAGGISGATIADSSISATSNVASDAIAIDVVLATDIAIRGNNVAATAQAGQFATALRVESLLPSLPSSVTVSGNTLSAAGGATNRHTHLDPGSAGGTGGVITILGDSSGNVVGAGSCSIAGIGTVVGSIGYTDGSTCP